MCKHVSTNNSGILCAFPMMKKLLQPPFKKWKMILCLVVPKELNLQQEANIYCKYNNIFMHERASIHNTHSNLLTILCKPCLFVSKSTFKTYWITTMHPQTSRNFDSTKFLARESYAMCCNVLYTMTYIHIYIYIYYT